MTNRRRISIIQEIIRQQDVRDPRVTLDAIARIVEQPVAKPVKPLLKLTVEEGNANHANLTVRFSKKRISPKHVIAAITTLEEFGNEMFGKECNDPSCPVHGDKSKPEAPRPLRELFEKLEADLFAKNKGSLQ